MAYKKPICPYCGQPVKTRGEETEWAKPTGRAVPKKYGPGTYHFDHYFAALEGQVVVNEPRRKYDYMADDGVHQPDGFNKVD